MVSKTIKYVDYNGVEKTGTYWFNMSRADLFSLELEGDEGWTDRVKRLIAEQNTREVVKIIEKFIRDSYGVKTPDGGFDKDPKHLEKFMQTDAYSELIWEFVEHPDEFGEFINGIVASVKKKVDAIDVDAELEKAKAAGNVVTFVTPTNP